MDGKHYTPRLAVVVALAGLMAVGLVPDASAATLEERVADLETAVADLQSQIAAIPDPAVPLNLFVNCSAGDTIAGALVQARRSFAPVTIHVQGICKERVLVDRDDLRLQGASAGAGLDGSGLAGTEALLTIAAAHRVAIRDLWLGPDGLTGLRAEHGATLHAARLEIEKAGHGIAVLEDASAFIERVVVRDSSETGIIAQGGALEIVNSAVIDGAGSGVTVSAGSLRLHGSKVYGNGAWGVSVIESGTATITASDIVDNRVGMLVRMGASALIGSGAVLKGNDLEGLRVWDGSSALLGINSTVASNGLSGVVVSGGSVLVPQQTIIEDNGGHGIEVRDTSLSTSTSGAFPEIHHNAGWGVWCESFPGDARLGTPGFPAASVSANGAGQLRCPGFMIP